MIQKIKLREKDINKLSSIIRLPTEALQKLASMNIIDTTEVLLTRLNFQSQRN